MPALFAAAVAAVTEFVAGLSLSSVAAFAGRTLLTIGIAKLLANRTGTTAAGSQTSGARVQLTPATNNAVPILYGSGWVSPIITDAVISADNTTMWYCCVFSEVPDTSDTFKYGTIYYDNRVCVFDTVDKTKVVGLLNISKGKLQERTTVDGNLYMYLYSNGSNSGFNTTQTAIQVMNDSAIPIDFRWPSTNTMDNCC